MSQDKILDRIMKLLRLSKSTNEHEAAAAAAQAASMMAEHELDEATIRIQAEDKGETKAAEPIKTENIGESWKRIAGWMLHLLSAVAYGFGCKAWWWHEGLNWSAKFFGRTSNVQTARYMFLFLNAEIERLAKEAWSQESPRPVAAAAIAWRNSFMLGAVATIRARLAEKRNQMFAPPSGTSVTVVNGERVFSAAQDSADKSKALVLVRKDQEEVEAEYKAVRRKLGLHSMGTSSGPSRRDAYDQGKTAGNSINLNSGRSLGAPAKQIRQ